MKTVTASWIRHRGKFPERPALIDLVDPVHRAAESADISRRRPQGAENSRDERETGAACVDHAGEDLAQFGVDIADAGLVEQLQESVDG